MYINIRTSDVNEYEKKMNISYVLHYKTGVYTRKGSTDVLISTFICAKFCHNLNDFNKWPHKTHSLYLSQFTITSAYIQLFFLN